MSDPIQRPHKRLATLTGAGIAAMLSPSGKIISSAAAAGIIVAAAVGPKIFDDRARVTSLPSPPPAATIASLPVSHVLIPHTDGEDIPVVLTEHASEERKHTPVDAGNESQWVIAHTQPGSPTSNPSVAAPLGVASLPAPPGQSPARSFPRAETPPPPLVEAEVLDPPIVSDPPRKEDLTDEEKTDDEKQADTGETPEDNASGNDPDGSPPTTRNPPVIVTSFFPPRVAATPDDAGGGDTGPVDSLAGPSVAAAVIPEPGLLGLMLTGLAGIVGTARRRHPK